MKIATIITNYFNLVTDNYIENMESNEQILDNSIANNDISIHPQDVKINEQILDDHIENNDINSQRLDRINKNLLKMQESIENTQSANSDTSIDKTTRLSDSILSGHHQNEKFIKKINDNFPKYRKVMFDELEKFKKYAQ